MIHTIRVGLLLVGIDWQGGVSYIESLVRAVSALPRNERPELYFIVGDHTVDAFEQHRSLASLFDGIFLVGQDINKAKTIIRQPFNHVESISALAQHIDFFYPVMYDGWPQICSASWIPDFQYAHLPHFFSGEELNRLLDTNKQIAEKARLIVFSSTDAANDFQKLFPESTAIRRILPFHFLPQYPRYSGDPTTIQRKHRVPDNFFICCNQFWQHKNHLCLFEAVTRLRQEGTIINVVCTGGTHDYRAKTISGRCKRLL